MNARPLFLASAMLFSWSSAQPYGGLSRVTIDPKTLEPVTITQDTFRTNANQVRTAGVQAGYEIVKYSPASNYASALRGTSSSLGSKAFSVAKGGLRFIGVGALMQVGALSINAALNYFYNTLKQSTGTPLDQYTGAVQWWSAVPQGSCQVSWGPMEPRYGTSPLQYDQRGQIYIQRNIRRFDGNTYTHNHGVYNGWKAEAPSTTCTAAQMQESLQAAQIQARNSYSGANVSPSATWQPYMQPSRYLSNSALGATQWETILANPGADLATIIETQPAAYDALRNTVMPKYLDDHPPTDQDLEQGKGPGGSTFVGQNGQPLTINHIYGGPKDQTADTDGDGFNDYLELRSFSPMDDPQIIPGDLDNDGTVDIDDPDQDGDGATDEQEDAAGTNRRDPQSIPASLDFDQDGIPNDTDPDDDNDGVPDASDPDPLNKNVPVKCSTGMTPSADGMSCVPAKSDDGCPEGYRAVVGADPPKCEPIPDTENKDPVSDTCGDFSVKRLVTHTGHYLRDVLVPCQPPDWTLLSGVVKDKFPFSVVAHMGNFFKGTDGSGTDSALPTKLGMFDLNFDFASSFFLLIRTVWRAFLWWAFFTWLVGRLSGQVVLS